MKRVYSFIIIIFLFIIFVNPVISSSDWVEYSRTNVGNGLFYKKGRIDKDGEKYLIQVWEKEIFSDRGRDNFIQYLGRDGSSMRNKPSYLINSSEIDCKRQMNRTLSVVVYDVDDKILTSHLVKEPKWEYIVTKSNMESLRKKVCK